MKGLLTKKGVRYFRAAVGIAALVVAVGLLVSGVTELALKVSILVLSGFALTHLAVDYCWDKLTGAAAGGNVGDARPAHERGSGATVATVQLVVAIITTAGVVLGLLQAFSKGVLSQSAKVGTVSLAGDLVLSFVLFGLVVDRTPTNDKAWHFRGYIFNVVLWGLAFGLLCIALSLAYGTGTK